MCRGNLARRTNRAAWMVLTQRVRDLAGLLGLAGRWGPRTRFWLSAALASVGSGSLAAFDRLELFLIYGTGLSGSGWTLADTVLVIEAVIGCCALPWAPWRPQPPPGTTRDQQQHRARTEAGPPRSWYPDAMSRYAAGVTRPVATQLTDASGTAALRSQAAAARALRRAGGAG